jgi:hypothetical protein
MKLSIERGLLTASPQALAAWGASEAGLPCLVLVVGSDRVVCEMTPEEAKEVSTLGIFVAVAALQAGQARAGNPGGVAAGLVDASGHPLRATNGGG